MTNNRAIAWVQGQVPCFAVPFTELLFYILFLDTVSLTSYIYIMTSTI